MAMDEKNTFHDINQLPQDEGLLIFGISMNRVGNTQSPEKCFEYLQHIDTKIIRTKGIGAVFTYADYLYLFSEEKASLLRNRFLPLMMQHKNGLLRILEKDTAWVARAFSFMTWGQLLLDMSREIDFYRSELLRIYHADERFRKYISDDCALAGKTEDENARAFFLEEILLFYLTSKGIVSFPNSFVGGHEKWVLHCYPGKPLKSEAYLYQKNLLGLKNTQNKYESCYYDLSGKTLYDLNKIDIDSFDFQD